MLQRALGGRLGVAALKRCECVRKSGNTAASVERMVLLDLLTVKHSQRQRPMLTVAALYRFWMSGRARLEQTWPCLGARPTSEAIIVAFSAAPSGRQNLHAVGTQHRQTGDGHSHSPFQRLSSTLLAPFSRKKT